MKSPEDTIWRPQARRTASRLLRAIYKLKSDKRRHEHALTNAYSRYALSRLSDNSRLLPTDLAELDLSYFGSLPKPADELEGVILSKLARTAISVSGFSWEFVITSPVPMDPNSSPTQLVLRHSRFLLTAFAKEEYQNVLPVREHDRKDANTLISNFLKCQSAVRFNSIGQDPDSAFLAVNDEFETLLGLLEYTISQHNSVIIAGEDTRTWQFPLSLRFLIVNNGVPYDWGDWLFVITSQHHTADANPDHYAAITPINKRKIELLVHYCDVLNSISDIHLYRRISLSLRCYLNSQEAATESSRLMHLWQACEQLAGHHRKEIVAERLQHLCGGNGRFPGMNQAILHLGDIRNTLAHANKFGRHHHPSRVLKRIYDYSLECAFDQLNSDRGEEGFLRCYAKE